MTVRYLSDEEIDRIKAELFDNVLGVGATPYFNIRGVYSVIQDYVTSSATDPTTSSTTVSTAGPTTISVASASGLSAGTRIVIDVDQQRETVTVRNVSGTTLSVICSKLHSGTYPVEIESGITIVRGFLSDLANLEQVRTVEAFAALGLKQVDEVVWQDGQSGNLLSLIHAAKTELRSKLAAATGMSSLFIEAMQRAQGHGGSVEIY
jgi:hypothetical protein